MSILWNFKLILNTGNSSSTRLRAHSIVSMTILEDNKRSQDRNNLINKEIKSTMEPRLILNSSTTLKSNWKKESRNFKITLKKIRIMKKSKKQFNGRDSNWKLNKQLWLKPKRSKKCHKRTWIRSQLLRVKKLRLLNKEMQKVQLNSLEEIELTSPSKWMNSESRLLKHNKNLILLNLIEPLRSKPKSETMLRLNLINLLQKIAN